MEDVEDVNKFVNDKVEEELKKIDISSRGLSKAAKDAIESILPGITKVISVAVSTAVTSAMSLVMKDLENKMKTNAHYQRVALLNKFECDKLEQYQRRDNIRILGLDGEQNEKEDELENKVIGLANDLGVTLTPEDISVVHRVGRPIPHENRPVIVRFTQRKKKIHIMKKKSELKKKQRKEFINEDLTALRATLFKIVREQSIVKNATTIDGKIFAWLNSDPSKALIIETPDDLFKVGVSNPDWKKLKLDYLFDESL